VEYDGSAFAGFQRQSELPSVQAALETAIHAGTGFDAHVTAAGRTDSGAHAAGQVISFAVDTKLDNATLLRAINAHLSRDVALQSLTTTDDDFDPRRTAISREYHYLVLNRAMPSPLWRGRAHIARSPLDVDAMCSAATALVGVHDFSAFATPSRPDGISVREIYRLDVAQEGELITFRVAGNGFMQHMIRTIVGTLLLVGEGRDDSSEVASILRSRDRKRAAPPVPACGLYLVNVTYDDSAGQDSRRPLPHVPSSRTGWLPTHQETRA
jgi:tRNA pseudouridine38-40 synthase